MLFILHNNVVIISLFACFLLYFLYCFLYSIHILFTHFIYILHIFCSFFSLFLRKNNALLVHYNVLPCVFNALLCVFPSISYNFLYICTNIARISPHICTALHFASFFIFCTFVQTFSTYCTKIALAKCHSLYKLFGIFAQTFSSLPPHFFQLVRNFMTICFQLFHSFPQLFLM